MEKAKDLKMVSVPLTPKASETNINMTNGAITDASTPAMSNPHMANKQNRLTANKTL